MREIVHEIKFTRYEDKIKATLKNNLCVNKFKNIQLQT